METKDLNKLRDFKSSIKMPVLFLGHGSPMNAIEENEFVKGFRKIGMEVPKPNAVLCISAHWETKGTFVTAMENPRTIHDFGGFPKELYDIQYPSPGDPELANNISSNIKKAKVELNHNWGLDHGAWSVIRHMYPDADVPLIQLSLDYTKPAQYHFELAQELSFLREKGVLIIGSGNLVHNLGMVDWRKLSDVNYAYDWAEEADSLIKNEILNGDSEKLIKYHKLGNSMRLAIPTPEHYLPLIYTLALKEENDTPSFFNDKLLGGSISMTSLKLG